MRLFPALPTITYNGVTVKSIVSRFKIVDAILSRYDVFYPYVITDDDRPDTLAYDYYGDSRWDWLIMMTNRMIDPYHDWPLTEQNLISHLVKKYNTTISSIQSTVKHYKYTGISGNTQSDIDRISWTITPETWALMTADEKSGWSSVSVYDWEVEQNDAKRSIQLLGKQFLPQLDAELKKLFR